MDDNDEQLFVELYPRLRRFAAYDGIVLEVLHVTPEQRQAMDDRFAPVRIELQPALKPVS